MKFVGAISSLVSGIMVVIGLSLTCFSSVFTSNGWDLIKLANNEATGTFLLSSDAGFVLFKLFAIIGFIFGMMLILYGIFLLLIDLKVLKVKSKVNLYMINNILLSLFVLCMLLSFIGAWVMKGDYVGGILYQASVGIGPWLMFIIPAALCICSWLLARKPSKK